VNVRRGIGATALATLAALVPVGAARADGAFPAGQAVLVPADQPQEITLVTNFGFIISEDGGQTWSWTCEQDDNAFGVLYQRGPAPRRRLFGVANGHAIYSDDTTCSWQIGGGLLAAQSVTDVFPDPTNAERVLAIGAAGGVTSVFESGDGGATFGAMLYQASGGDEVNGAEIARSDPRIIYLALMTPERVPKLARTSDGGASWTVSDLGADLGAGRVRIIAVDPNDADTVLLRWLSPAGGEAIGVTRDGGATASKPLSILHYFTSFARMPGGALILSGMASVNQRIIPVLFSSHDGGATFQQHDVVPGVLALGQRDGVLYAATDNFTDGYALGASSDEGATWQPVVRFDQIASIRTCLRANAQCQASCRALAGVGLGSPGKIWEETVCTGSAGSGGAGGAGGARAGPGSSGCGCAVAPAWPGAAFGLAVLIVALFAVALRRERE
jgi:MYXO-CTERM domain-containing protein